MIRSIFAKILAASLLVVLPVPTLAAVDVGIGVAVRVGPPAIPYYEQPPVPEPGLIWTPGYWAWSGDDYYWVPGTWVAAPEPGVLWTPGYWAFRAGYYGWHPGYWGPRVGFYGGVNYGYGYFGVGFVGGAWDHGVYRYNGAYANVDRTVERNVYVDKTVVNNFDSSTQRVSYNGGPGGTRATPTEEESAAATAEHMPPTSEQTQHEQAASQDKSLFSKSNAGHPQEAAVAKPYDASHASADPSRSTMDRTSPEGNAARPQGDAGSAADARGDQGANGAGDKGAGADAKASPAPTKGHGKVHKKKEKPQS